MPNFRRFLLRRRLLACLGVAALGSGLLMLHPYPRQSLFGPTIRGKPWCVWEEDIRRQVGPDRAPWFYRMLAKFGLIKERDVNERWHSELLPVFLFLADDRDAQVRLAVVNELDRRVNGNDAPKEPDETIPPVLRRMVQDDDPVCRMRATFALWRLTSDSKLKVVALPLSQHADPFIREHAVMMLCEMARLAPDLFDPLSRLTGDANANLRGRAVQSMTRFGNRGLPFVERALRDTDKDVRMYAFRAAGEYLKVGEPLIPSLQELQNSPDPVVRHDAALALHRIAPKTFPAID
jgi:HEAT repeat protein